MTAPATASASPSDPSADDDADDHDHDAAPAPSPTLPGMRRQLDDRVNWKTSVPFLLVNLTPLLVVFTGVSWKAVALFMVTYWTRMFFITAGYHRYFSHRTYQLARVPQFLLAFGGTTAVQKGPLWWASHHRDHHRYSDTESDVHSPQKGFWWSHVGWILCDKYATTKMDRIKDFAEYPELRFLNRFDWIGPWLLAAACLLIAGWQGLVIGFFMSTVLLWHSTFFINSLAHVFGRRRYATEDTSRNSIFLAILTMGEGWHNNHHYYPTSCRNGFYWWEWDPTYYVLCGLKRIGIVKDMKAMPKRMLRANRVKDGNFDIGMFRASWAKAARAVHAASSHMGGYVHDKRQNAGDALGDRRRALEGFVSSSMESAEELAKASRRRERELAVEQP